MDCSKPNLPPDNPFHVWNRDKKKNTNTDVSTIKGNISDDLKRFGLAAWDFFAVGTTLSETSETDNKTFGVGIGKRLKFVEMNIWGEKGLSYAETICVITIDKGIVVFDNSQVLIFFFTL